MSMKTWTEEGFGMLLFTEHNEDKVCEFIKKYNPELLPTEDELKSALESGEEIGDILQDSLGEPVSWHVANIINDLEGTTVFKGYASCGDTNQEEMIGIEPFYPWTGNEVDRALTKDTATAILNKYARILGIKEEPEYFVAEYFG